LRADFVAGAVHGEADAGVGEFGVGFDDDVEIPDSGSCGSAPADFRVALMAGTPG
jgi:hypothetical protein